MYAHSIVLLLTAVVASALICPNASTSSTNNFAVTVEMSFGRNSTCNEGEVLALRDAIDTALNSMNVTNKSGGPTKELNASICTDNNTLHRNLLLTSKFTWAFRACE